MDVSPPVVCTVCGFGVLAVSVTSVGACRGRLKFTSFSLPSLRVSPGRAVGGLGCFVGWTVALRGCLGPASESSVVDPSELFACEHSLGGCFSCAVVCFPIRIADLGGRALAFMF